MATLVVVASDVEDSAEDNRVELMVELVVVNIILMQKEVESQNIVTGVVRTHTQTAWYVPQVR